MPNPKNLLFCIILSTIVIAGCPKIPEPPIPTITPTPSSSFTPLPIVTQAPIIGDIFKVEFGPGSKGVSTFAFGPGSKGINEFGPGSKGVSEFGPGSKGVSNLRFNINIPPTLVRSELSFNTNSFKTKAVAGGPLQLGNLLIYIKKEDKTILKTTLLPAQEQIILTLFSHDIEPGTYNLLVLAENNFETLQAADLVKLESNLEVKIVLYDKDQKRENLDIAIRTKPIQELTE
jgi:hypothetical protein